jgi:hypothetical protein
MRTCVGLSFGYGARHMSHSIRLVFFLTSLLVAGSAAMGCTPSIGDKCVLSTDCSSRGDRLCDTSQPGGYCTIFNCEPDTCPEESQCVAFDQRVDPACYDPQNWARFERTFCMKRCSSDSDCRSGYQCFDLSTQSNPWGASVVDTDPSGLKICISPSSGSSAPADADAGIPAVCRPYDGGGFPDVGYGTDSGGDAGVDAAPDATSDGAADASSDGAADASSDSASKAD